eukprot:TRINITY_DN47158_c0_g1_i1.p1 TRINITY_DN47158_c0_g1~~TRINITY_DN47158_c0_g1_i1.p1  ORF type:complete len:293 (-),score=54.99 TRINITY_DN47158_c0_g1_i1:86-916(-)
MFSFCENPTDAPRANVSSDEALARSLQEQELEQQDAVLARQLASQEARETFQGQLPSQQRVIDVRCGVCQMQVRVAVPLSAAPGTAIRADCPQCTASNNFNVPAPVAMPSSTSAFSPGLLSALGSGGASAMPPPADSDALVYVACEVGNTAVEMMVDTGAQSSVISMPLVRRLQLETHLDSRYQGMASGVGTARILGKLRGVPVKLGHVEFALDFSVLGVDDPLLLLGIDQLRRFRCIVDLDKQQLVFGGSGGVEVAFLPPSPSQLSYRTVGCPTM